MNINDVLTNVKIPEEKKPKKLDKVKKVVENISVKPKISKNNDQTHVYGLGEGYDSVLERINQLQPEVYNSIRNLD